MRNRIVLPTLSYPLRVPADEVTLRIMMRPMGLEVIDELIEHEYLDESIRDALPTFALLPNRSIDETGITTDVTVRWKAEDRIECVSVGQSGGPSRF